MKADFTYSNNAPHTGSLISFGAGGYQMQFNGAYGGGNGLAFRNRNGDTASWNAWNTVIHSNNYNSYAPTLTGTGASGTWGIAITGNAATATTATNLSGGTVNATTGTFSSTVAINGGNGLRAFVNGGASIVSHIYFANAANNRAYNWQLDESSNAALWGYGGSAWAKLLSITSAGALNTAGAITQNGSQVLTAANYNSYAPTLTGTGASGTWGINITGSSASCTGNAATATTATNVTGTVAIANGGTGSTTAAGARTNLSAQETLVSGTNIKTINSTSLLGSGDIAIQAFPSGTKMMFVQTAAPTGWTKDTTHNNKALRVVNGTASSGGTTGFSSVFTSRTPAGSVATTTTTSDTTATGSLSGGAVGATTLSTAQMPSHNHSQYYSINRNINNTYNTRLSNTAENYTDSSSIFNAGGGGSHNHSFTNPSFTGTAHNHAAASTSTFTGSSMDFNVQYVDVIIATKD